MGFMLFIAFLLSCNKDATKPDTIVYHDIIPDHELQTVRFYEFQDHIICTAYVPTPADSSVVCEIDMDGDQHRSGFAFFQGFNGGVCAFYLKVAGSQCYKYRSGLIRHGS